MTKTGKYHHFFKTTKEIRFIQLVYVFMSSTLRDSQNFLVLFLQNLIKRSQLRSSLIMNEMFEKMNIKMKID